MHREYVLQEFIGRYAVKVKKVLTDIGIRIKYKTAQKTVEDIEENCVVKTLHATGTVVHDEG